MAELRGYSESGWAVWGSTNNGTGTVGTAGSGTGAYGDSRSGTGVVGRSYGSSGIGVAGRSPGTAVLGEGGSNAVWGIATSEFGTGVRGQSARGYAGWFAGQVYVGGYLQKSGGGFRIDHPHDPENKYLNHSFVESEEMKNIYDGTVTLDENGEAWVDLPEWLETLNKDFRYQLTAVGGAAPNLHVADEISGNRFRIAGGEGGMKVCWQVTGSRKDPWAAANPIEVEQEKPQEERGLYLQPHLYGAPEEQMVNPPERPPAKGELPQTPEAPPGTPPPGFGAPGFGGLGVENTEELRGQIEELRRQLEELKRRG